MKYLLPLWFLSLAATGCGSMSAAGNGGGGGEIGGHAIGEAMPELTLDEFYKRNEIKLSTRKGKVVLLDIWASWCVPCKDEMPALDDLARRLRGSGVEVIAVSIDEDRGAAEQFLKKRKKWNLTLAHDPNQAIPDRLQPPKMPTSYLIDRKGVLRHVNAGYTPGDEERLEAELRALAAE
jgi:cytochrome c biogenesis protein CcmG/thiol:disulfide interchange protein DsbE